MLNRETMERTLALLTAYANSGVSNEASLECAQVCRVLREELAQPATYQRGDLYALAREASRTDTTGKDMRTARDQLVEACLTLGGGA